MVKIIEPKIETAELKSDGTYGRFVQSPSTEDFGTTLGNSLRRCCSPRFLVLPLFL